MPVGPGVEGWILPALRDLLIDNGVKSPDMGLVSDLASQLSKVFNDADIKYLITKANGSQSLSSVYAGSVLDFYKQGLTYIPAGYDPATGQYDQVPGTDGDGGDGDGGGGSPTAPSGPSPEQLKAEAEYNYNQTEAFKSLLDNWQIEISPNLAKLVSQAEGSNWSMDAFLRHLRETSEYQDRFYGILDKNGQPKMSEAQYISQEKSYQSIAQANGLPLGDNRVDYLFKNNISVQEYADKAKAESLLRRNPQLYKQFSQTLAREGLAPKGGVTRKELFEFVMGMGNQKWYDAWNQAQARYAAVQGGLTIGGGDGQYTNISAQLIERFSKRGISPEDLATGFDQLAEGFMENLDMNSVTKLGVKKGDIVKAVFGGKGSQEARKLLEQVAKNYESGLEADVETQAYATEAGLKTVGGSKGQYAG
jgi:hypothetical protein